MVAALVDVIGSLATINTDVDQRCYILDSQTPMKVGDVVRISLEGVGYVENTVEEV